MSDTRIGRIYKIICSKSNDVYVGSTFNALRTRMAQHKGHFEQKLGTYPSFKRHGWESLHIILIAEYEVVDRKHLLMYETLWINRLKACNKIVSFQPFSVKEQIRLWYQCNKAKINERQSIRYQCGCGSNIRRDSKSDHERSKKHQMWQASSNCK